MVFILPGLTASCDEPYIRSLNNVNIILFYFRNMVEEVLKNGYKAVIYNERIVGPNPTVFISKNFFYKCYKSLFFTIFFWVNT